MIGILPKNTPSDETDHYFLFGKIESDTFNHKRIRGVYRLD